MVRKVKKAITKSTRKSTSKAKSKLNKSGKSAQHARAGRLGGLAPHVCRGSECTKLRREGKLRSKAGTKGKTTAAKSTLKKRAAHESILADLFGKSKTKKVAKRRTAAKAHKATSTKSKSTAKKRTSTSAKAGAGLRSKRGLSTRTRHASRARVTRAKKGASITDMIKNLF